MAIYRYGLEATAGRSPSHIQPSVWSWTGVQPGRGRLESDGGLFIDRGVTRGMKDCLENDLASISLRSVNHLPAQDSQAHVIGSSCGEESRRAGL
jgi:hypothetical protein